MTAPERKGRGAFSKTLTDRLVLVEPADAADQVAAWLDGQYGTARSCRGGRAVCTSCDEARERARLALSHHRSRRRT